MENKLSFKKVFQTAIVLMLIAGISGALIVLLNMVTEPIIKENEIKLEAAKLNEIYDQATFEILDVSDEVIEKAFVAKNNDLIMGYVYKVSGKNAYGTITLLVGINLDGTVKKTVIMENTESFATTVNDHFNDNYKREDLTQDAILDIDVKCGATYGAKLIKELVNYAINSYLEMKGGK